MASVEVGVRGQVWKQASCVVARNSQPNGSLEADTRNGRSVVESLNRWEKTIGLYRTASGVDISDGICARIVQRSAWLVT